jgi:AcrR family transcriptional regulator
MKSLAGTGAAAPAGRGPAGASRRQRNARGQGSKLTEEIVAAALALIDRTGTTESVTLRAVAREIGIAAPSIYGHFPDREAIVLAVVARLFDELTTAIQDGVSSAPDDPVERLVAGCEQYVQWGLSHSARYSVLFQSRWTEADRAAEYCQPVPIGAGGPPVPEFGAEAFAHLVDAIAACVQAGASASTDVVGDGTAVWVAMHGTVTLRTTLPRFPWPEPVAWFVRQLVLPLAKVRESAGPGHEPGQTP